MGYLHVYPLQITSQWSPSFSWQFKAFKCNLKEFTTKTRAPASLADSGWSGGVCTVILYIILVANDLGIARSFFGQCCLPRVFFSNYPPPPHPCSPSSSVFPLIFQCDRCLLSCIHGGLWLGCRVVPAMRALFNVGADSQKWTPLDIPGTQPPLSDAVVNQSI